MNPLPVDRPIPADRLRARAAAHLWLQNSDQSGIAQRYPMIVRGENHEVFDAQGNRYFDGISGLFVVNAGHGRAEIAAVAERQMSRLAYFPLWSALHEPGIELAAQLAEHAPGDLNRVFFTNSGSESIETSLKLAKQFWRIRGFAEKTKFISRDVAYHGTTQGAASITRVPGLKRDFSPFVPGSVRVSNTNLYRAEERRAPTDPEAFGAWCADEIEAAILREGADTVAAIVIEPIQNAGGCLVPPPGYLQRVRQIATKHDILVIADEVISGFCRIDGFFASAHYGLQPDIITAAKGLASGYAPIGAVVVSDRVYEPFAAGEATFAHGHTFAGHPVSTAVALENLRIMQEEGLTERAQSVGLRVGEDLQTLRDIPVVGDVRGDGFFWGIELVADQGSKLRFSPEKQAELAGATLPRMLMEHGMYCRIDTRGDFLLHFAPPVSTPESALADAVGDLRAVLTEFSEAALS